MQTVGDRLRIWIQKKNYTIGGVERVSGLGNATLKTIQTPSSKTLNRIKDKFPDLDLDYIVNGNDDKGQYKEDGLTFRVDTGSARVLEYDPKEEQLKLLEEENRKLREQIEELSKKENKLLSVLYKLTDRLCGEKPSLEDLDNKS